MIEEVIAFYIGFLIGLILGSLIRPFDIEIEKDE
jgi:hypothetical protein